MSDPWWPEGYKDPAFVVQRTPFGVETGGDYVRGSSVTTLAQTALRYPTTVKGFDAVKNKAYMTVRPLPHQSVWVEHPDGLKHEYKIGRAELQWGWPTGITENWSEVALVRSGFGYPNTPTDGETVFRALKVDFVDDEDNIDTPPPAVIDQPLQRGHYFYYSLFFKTTAYDWIVGMSASVLIPRDYQHAQHLWDALPPFYQATDSNIREGTGPLRQFLEVFGFELDHTREYVEQWQETYHIDKSPLPLLRGVGANFGVPYRTGVGDGRYRAMIAGLPEMLLMRGTPVALKQVITTGTKWACDITLGSNTMILPDDSDFHTGTGSWAPLYGSTSLSLPILDYHKIIAVSDGSLGAKSPPAGYGQGVMRVATLKADQTADFVLACGAGEWVHIDPATAVYDESTYKEILPLYAGIPVEPGSSYGFSVRIAVEATSTITALLLWIDASGYPQNALSFSAGTPAAPGDTDWHEYLVQAIAPTDAVYMVPAVRFTGRAGGSSDAHWSKFIDFAGAMSYVIDQAGAAISVTPPDKYLTLGNPNELLGAYDPAHPDTTGYVLGDG